MSLQVLAGLVSAYIAIISYIPYIVGIFRGTTKPSRASFGIWTLIGSVEALSYIGSGARTAIWLPVVYAVGSIVIFILSLKRGVGGTSKLDIACLALALLGVAGWIITDNAEIALYLSIFAAAMGFVPTIKKAWIAPHTESVWSWGMASFASFINLFAISSLTLYEVSHPVFIFLFDLILAILTIFPRAFRKKR